MTEIKVLCRFCELKTTCKRRQQKQKYEDAGWQTYCTSAKPIKRSGNNGQKARTQRGTQATRPRTQA